jgi:hypothetical protein
MTQQNIIGMVTIDYRFNKSLTLILNFTSIMTLHFLIARKLAILNAFFCNANIHLHHKFNMQQINIENHVKFIHS